MSERLIIRLAESAHAAVPWLLLDRNGAVQAQGQLESANELGELTDKARGRQLVVLVSSAAVTLHQVEPPPGGRRNLRQALPYLLEEELATEVDSLHFALGPQTGDNRQAVAVVSHEQMALWLDWLQAAQLTPRYLVPELLCVPEPGDDAWQVHAIDQLRLIRQGAWQGSAVEPDWLPAWLQGQDKPGVVHCSTGQLAEAFGSLGLKTDIAETAPQHALAPLAKRLPQLPFSLLQGAYKPGQGLGKSWQIWRRVAVLGALALFIQLVMGYTELTKLRQQQAEFKAASEGIYRELFGRDARIVNLRAQMRQKLQELGQTEQAPGFLDLLTTLEPTLRQDAKLTMTGLKYDARRDELKLNARAADFAGFEQFASRLEAASLSVEQGALRRDRQGQINGEVTVREVR